MGTPQPTMAATQILVALCVVGSAVAAPQLSLGRSRSAGTNYNEGQVVTSVITSLTPSISRVVEEALAALAAEQAAAARQQQIAAANAAAAAAAAEKNSFDSQVSADLGPFVDPVYNFEYKVADDVEKTYISRNEERDGNELSGSDSFIEATGATSSSSRFGSSSGSRSSSVATPSSSQSDLIAQILAALTPQINSAVAAALA